MLWFIAFLVSLGGSILQSSLGFGNGVFMMNFYPSMFEYQKAVALVQVASVSLTCAVVVRRFRFINWRVLFPILIPAFISSVIATRLSMGIDTSLMKLMLGILLIVLSIYFSFSSKNVSLKPDVKSGVIAGLVAGAGTGLFGIGGPIAAMYFTPALSDKDEYIATIQCYFFLNGSLSLFVRLMSMSIFSSNELSLVGLVILAAVIGTFAGLRLVSMMNAALLKKLIYAFIGINGLVIIAQYFMS